jgi:hypothetical protein
VQTVDVVQIEHRGAPESGTFSASTQYRAIWAGVSCSPGYANGLKKAGAASYCMV